MKNGHGVPGGYPRPYIAIVNAHENIPIIINRNVTYVLSLSATSQAALPSLQLQYTERFNKSREKRDEN